MARDGWQCRGKPRRASLRRALGAGCWLLQRMGGAGGVGVGQPCRGLSGGCGASVGAMSADPRRAARAAWALQARHGVGYGVDNASGARRWPWRVPGRCCACAHGATARPGTVVLQRQARRPLAHTMPAELGHLVWAVRASGPCGGRPPCAPLLESKSTPLAKQALGQSLGLWQGCWQRCVTRRRVFAASLSGISLLRCRPGLLPSKAYFLLFSRISSSRLPRGHRGAHVPTLGVHCTGCSSTRRPRLLHHRPNSCSPPHASAHIHRGGPRPRRHGNVASHVEALRGLFALHLCPESPKHDGV